VGSGRAGPPVFPPLGIQPQGAARRHSWETAPPRSIAKQAAAAARGHNRVDGHPPRKIARDARRGGGGGPVAPRRYKRAEDELESDHHSVVQWEEAGRAEVEYSGGPGAAGVFLAGELAGGCVDRHEEDCAGAEHASEGRGDALWKEGGEGERVSEYRGGGAGDDSRG
jgi:hypothetical protein